MPCTSYSHAHLGAIANNMQTSIRTLPDHFRARFRFLGTYGSWDTPCIYKAPPRMRNPNAEAYEPRVVAIGPNHYGKEHLVPMESHKRRALWHFVMIRARGWRLDQVVDRFMDADVLRLLRASYDAKLDAKWDDDYALACLAVLDGCFLLELMLSHREEHGHYKDDDPIFGEIEERRHAIHNYVRTDLLLIENQLPLWVVGRLTEIAQLRVELNELVRAFYGTRPEDEQHQEDEPLGLHILDVFYKSRLSSGDYTGWTVPYGAQELSYNRIRIRGGPRNGSLRNISFAMKRQNPLLYTYRKLRSIIRYLFDRVRLLRFLRRLPPLSIILWLLWILLMIFLHLTLPLWLLHAELVLPCITIDETTEAVFLNLMAFEVLHLGMRSTDMGVTCYVILLRSIIRSKEDVRLLREVEVLMCVPERTDKEVVELLSKVTQEVVVDDGLVTENGKMKKMCMWQPNRSLAWLQRNLSKHDFKWLRMIVTTLIAIYGLILMIYFAMLRSPK